jgi:uncharacterized UPF0146 family protein
MSTSMGLLLCGPVISFSPVGHDRRAPVADFLARYERVCEVGIGRRHGVARRLAERGVAVTATDVEPRAVPDGVRFVEDDVVTASERAAAGDDPGEPYHADAVYALNCPPELHRPLAVVSEAVGADCSFTTLGGDDPVIPVERRALPGGETLFLVRGGGLSR